jgi:hypothetical protein
MRGGFRHGRAGPRHRDGARALEPTRPPRPPRGLSDVERSTWLELAAQVEAARTYNPTRYSAFRLAVKALAMVYDAPADLKPTSMRGLIEAASKMLSRFGLDPVGVLQAERAPAPPTRDEHSGFEDVE